MRSIIKNHKIDVLVISFYKKVAMLEKPIYFREETWEFLKDHWQKIKSTPHLIKFLNHLGYEDLLPSMNDETLFETILQNPGPLLVHLGIMELPHLLENTVICDDLEFDYIIDKKACQELINSQDNILLKRLYDKVRRPFTKEQIKKLIIYSDTFDQLAQDQN